MTDPPRTVPRREPMSDAERQLRDRLRKRWIENHMVIAPRNLPDYEEFGARYTAWQNRPFEPIAIYTTTRMFDDRFWAMKYRFVTVRSRYELVKGSVRQRAKRKDAKAIARDYALGN